MTALTRTAACGFTLDDAYSFAEVQQAADEDRLEPLIIPTDRLFLSLPAVTLNETQTRLYRNGVLLALSRLRALPEGTRFRIYSAEQSFLGLADADRAHNCLRIYKNL